MTVPTIGRIVWVRRPNTKVPHAALVTHVHHSGRVNVACFTPSGAMTALVGLHFRHEGKSTEPQYAEWPERS